MKKSIILFVMLVFHFVSNCQTPEPHEIRFKLYNESGQVLTYDSLRFDTLNLIESPSHLISYSYDSSSNYHIAEINTFHGNLPIHWVRNGKVMDFYFVVHDTISRKIEYYSFDHIQFEEGQFTIRVRVNTSPCETYEASKVKYFEHVAMHEKNGALHFTWDSLEAFEADHEDWCTEFDIYLGDEYMIQLASPAGE